MARERYENDKSKDAELRIAKAFIDFIGVGRPLKLSWAYGLDFAIVMPGKRIGCYIGCYIEAKDRGLKFGRKGGYYISLLKVMAARRIAATSKTPCYLVVCFDDGVMRWADFSKVPNRPCIEFGRRDRNDEYDIEPCCILDWGMFNVMHRGKS